MLKLNKRCVLESPDGSKREFRVLSTLPDGVLLLLSAQDGETFRFLASSEEAVETAGFLRDHAIALDPRTGAFLTQNELSNRLETSGNPLLRLLLTA